MDLRCVLLEKVPQDIVDRIMVSPKLTVVLQKALSE